MKTLRSISTALFAGALVLSVAQVAPATAATGDGPATFTEVTPGTAGGGIFTFDPADSVAEPVQLQSRLFVSVDGQHFVDDNNWLPATAAAPKPTVDKRDDRTIITQELDLGDVDLSMQTAVKDTGDNVGEVSTTLTFDNNGSDQAWLQVDVIDFLLGLGGGTILPDGEATTEGLDPVAPLALSTGAATMTKRYGYGFTAAATGDNSVGLLKNSTGGNIYMDPKTAGTQRVQWFEPIDAGDTAIYSVSTTFEADASSVDSDSDGLPNLWETEGVTIGDTYYPLQLWGADPQKPDVFLQLNWQKSEFKTLGCTNTTEAATALAKAQTYIDCNERNGKTRSHVSVREFAPTPGALGDLVDKFAEQDINLHIDAGEWTNIPNYGTVFRKGGETLAYQEHVYASRSENANTVLSGNLTSILGERQAIFRLGVLRDYLYPAGDPGRRISGIGSMGSPTFIVANFQDMNSDAVRNTIMHEFGHTLGLTHSGPDTNTDGTARGLYPLRAGSFEAFAPRYYSVMNYLYQWSVFDFTDTPVTQNSPEKTQFPANCTGTLACATEYSIPADWPGLDFTRGKFGTGGTPGGTLGTDATDIGELPDDEVEVIIAENAEDDEKVGIHEEVHTDEAERTSAKANNGTGAIFVDDDYQLVKERGDNFIKVGVRNYGSDEHTFTVELFYGDQVTTRDDIVVPGVSEETDKNQVFAYFPVGELANHSGTTLDVAINLRNEDGSVVDSINRTLAFLDATDEERAEAASKAETDPKLSAEEKERITNLDSEDRVIPTKVYNATEDQPKLDFTDAATEDTGDNSADQSSRPTVTSTKGTEEREVEKPNAVTVDPNPEPAPAPAPGTVEEEFDPLSILYSILGILVAIGIGAAAAFAMG